MIEQVESVPSESGRFVRLQCPAVVTGQMIMRRGTAFRRQEPVLVAGMPIRPATIGLLAEVGRSQVVCQRQPSIAVMATGDELVPSHQIPGPGQIRNSNGPMLLAWARAALQASASGDGNLQPRSAATGEVVDLGVARDSRAALEEKIKQGLSADVLLLSGGVSAGVLDLVPQVLESLGVQPYFHKVNVKPGKPLWFGVREAVADGEHRTLVFGLPGNPVSSLVSCELFVRPALNAMQNGPAATLHEVCPPRARLAQPQVYRGGRPTMFPAQFVQGRDDTDPFRTVVALDWKGSADICTLARADCLIEFSGPAQTFSSGDLVRIRPLSYFW